MWVLVHGVITAGASLLSTILFWAGAGFYVKKKPQKCNRESQSLLTSTPLTMKEQLWPIMTIFLPLIIFWALFFQQNSTWIQQGLDMDCYLNKLHIPPGKLTGAGDLTCHNMFTVDMMASLEDVMVLIVIIAMEYILFPHLNKTLHYNFPPLHKVN